MTWSVRRRTIYHARQEVIFRAGVFAMATRAVQFSLGEATVVAARDLAEKNLILAVEDLMRAESFYGARRSFATADTVEKMREAR